MTTRSEQIIAKEAEHVLQVYKRIPIMFVRGQGSHLIDEHGQKYLDLFSGIGVASLGHAQHIDRPHHRGLDCLDGVVLVMARGGGTG